MKAIKFCLVVICLSFFSVSQSNAQIIDSLPYFKALKHDLIILNKAKVKSLFNTDRTYKAMVDIKLLDIAAQQVVRLKTPLILKRGDNCIKIGCKEAPGGDCKSNCNLMWRDFNGDGKVQPRKELRCVCDNNGKCGIVVRRAKCN